MTFNFKMNFDNSGLKQYPKEAKGKLAKTVAKHSLIIEAKTKTSPNMPVDTGNLRDTIKAEKVDAMNWDISDATDYGIHQELGTRYIQAHHFLGGACEAQADKFFDEVREDLK